jgi:hypothetical protein
MSGIPSWCAIWLIPTKTPVTFSQFLGRFFSSLSVFFHVLRTIFSLRAFLPYLVFVMFRSSVSLAFMVASHLLWISVARGHSSSGSSLLTLVHLSFHMRCALSDIRIRYKQLASQRGSPSWLRKLVSPQPVIRPMFLITGQWWCFFNHRVLAASHTICWPGITHCRSMCSRSSVVLHFGQMLLCSKLGI